MKENKQTNNLPNIATNDKRGKEVEPVNQLNEHSK